jgi:hypothetical protein
VNFRELPVKKPFAGASVRFPFPLLVYSSQVPAERKGPFGSRFFPWVPGAFHYPAHSREPIVKERFQSMKICERHMREPCYRCCGGTE